MFVVLLYELQVLFAGGYLFEMPESREGRQEWPRDVADGRQVSTSNEKKETKRRYGDDDLSDAQSLRL